MRRKSNPKTQVQKTNLGHPPRSVRSELKINGSYFRASRPSTQIFVEDSSRAGEGEAEGVEGLLALDPAFVAIDADAEPESSEGAVDALALGLPLDDGHHVQEFGVRVGANADGDGIADVAVGGFEEVDVYGVCVGRERLGGGFEWHEAASFGERASIGGVALLAFAPFAVGPVESHGHQGVEMAGPGAEG